MTTPMLTASAVARNAISMETCAPLTTRASTSRPLTGSTPSGCASADPAPRAVRPAEGRVDQARVKDVRVLHQVRPDDGHQDQEDDEDPAGHGDLVALQPHPCDLAQRPPFDRLAADSLEDRFGRGGFRCHFQWRGHRGSISRLSADKPCASHAQGGLPNLYREDVPGSARSARGQQVSFLDCDLIRIFPSQHGHDRQSFLSRPLQAGQNPRRTAISRWSPQALRTPARWAPR